MSQTRAAALFLSLAGMILGVTQGSSASDVPDTPHEGSPGFALVKADWCDDRCAEECNGDCEDSFSAGCTCFWLCGNGESGESYCGEAAIPVMICAN